MTLTEDELARLAELEDLLTVGLVEQPINGSVLSWGEAALIAHRIGRHLLRATPVADTAGIDAAWREAEAVDALWDEPDPGTEDARDGLIWMTNERTMAAALRGLRAALRTPKPEGERCRPATTHRYERVGDNELRCHRCGFRRLG